MSNLIDIQGEVKEWSDRNFGEDAPADHKLLGIVEEVGELCHAVLKRKQSIRGDQDKHIMEERDALGDIMIFMMDYCNRRGIILEHVLIQTWDKVKERDWKSDPVDARGKA